MAILENLFAKNFKMTKPQKFLPQKFPNIRYTTRAYILTSPVQTSQKDPEYSGRSHIHSPHVQVPRPLQTC